MPQGAQCLTVQIQRGGACLWAIVDPAAPVVYRHVRIAGTGHPAPPEADYLGTLQMGDYVWHYFLEQL
jgi:hypothetical protein